MCYTFLKVSNSARVCNRLGERLCFETSQGIRPPIPLRSSTPPHGWVEEKLMCVVVLLRVRRIVLGVLGCEWSKLSRG